MISVNGVFFPVAIVQGMDDAGREGRREVGLLFFLKWKLKGGRTHLGVFETFVKGRVSEAHSSGRVCVCVCD